MLAGARSRFWRRLLRLALPRWPRPGPPRRLPPWRTLPLARPRQRRLRRLRRLPTKHRPLHRLGLPRPLIRRLSPWRTLPLARPRQRRLRRPRRLPTKHRPLHRLGMPRPLIRRLPPTRRPGRSRPSPQPRLFPRVEPLSQPRLFPRVEPLSQPKLFPRVEPLSQPTSPPHPPNLRCRRRPFPCAVGCRAPRAANHGRPAEYRYRRQPLFRRRRTQLPQPAQHRVAQRREPLQRALQHLTFQRVPHQHRRRKRPSPVRRRRTPPPPQARCPPLRLSPIRLSPIQQSAAAPRRSGCGRDCHGKPVKTPGQPLPKSRRKRQWSSPSPRRRRPLQLTTLRARKQRLHPLLMLHGRQLRCLLRTLL